MKNKALLLVLVVVFVNVLIFVVFKGRKAPKFPVLETELLDASSGKYDLLKNIKSVTIVSYYQSWCGDCRRELKELEALQEAVGGEQKLSIIMISDEPWSIIEKVKSTSKSSVQFFQAQKALRNIGIRRFPTTYLLNKNAEVTEAKVEGIHWNTKEIQDKIIIMNK